MPRGRGAQGVQRAHEIEPVLDLNYAEMIRHSRAAGTLWTVFTDARGRQIISGSESLPSRESLILAAMGMRNYRCSKNPKTGHSVMDGPHYLTRAAAERMIDRYLGSGRAMESETAA